MPWTKTPVLAALTRWIIPVLAVIAVLLWIRYAPPTAPWSAHRILGMPLPEPEKITQIEKVVVEVPVERIRVVPKEKIKVIYRDLPTPDTLQDNNAWVTSVVTTPPAPYGGTAAAILVTGPDNVATGKVEFLPTPAPFFEIKRVMGIRGGYGTEGILGELFIQPLRVGPINLEGRVYGRSDSGDSEVGAAILLEWKF